MRHQALVAITIGTWLFGQPTRAYAQTTTSAASTPRVELFGGYVYSPELDEDKVGSEAGHGLAVSLTANLWRHLGLVVDADWQSWTVQGPLDRVDLGTVGCSGPTQSEHCGLIRGDQDILLLYLSFGPRVHLGTGAFTAFGLATTGIEYSRFSEQEIAHILTAGGVELDTLGESTAGAWEFDLGGGADLALGRRVAVRLVQVNYSLGGFGQGPGRQLRIKTGIVARFD
ncbi:MAG: hypothetical protein OEW19_12935 [Acidobacteriota bacterium]|nr:hypothetical protein [Acidobacteriota bacterium]